MMEEVLNDSAPSVEVEVTATEPQTTESKEIQNVDYWQEDVDMDSESGEPKQEVDATDPVEEPTTEPDYITEGLGDLDKPLVVKVKGKVYDLKNLDQIRDLVEKGFVATQKMQEVAQMKRDLLSQQNPELTEQDLNQHDTDVEVERISQEILDSPIAEDFKGVLSSLPEDTLNEFRGNPQLLKGLRVDVESGFAKQIMPSVERYMAIDNMSFKEAYMRAGAEHVQNSEQGQKRQAKADVLSSAPNGSTAVLTSKPKDIWSMSDDDYNALEGTVRT